MIEFTCIRPDWLAPKNIQAFSTIRQGGISPPPYDSLNLGINVKDSIINIHKNRVILQENLKIPSEPIWLKQIHSNIVIPGTEENRYQEADASYTNQKDIVCTVLTADCLPILLCNRQGTYVAAIHAGWSGLQKQIIDSTLDHISCNPEDLMVWLGPAIGPKHFEVGDEVRDLFMDIDKNLDKAFTPSINNRWLCDMYAIARLQLNKRHVTQIYGGDHCTYSDSSKFYSYRRDGAETGRMASLIWINGSTHLN
jgi:YfiH family protein